MITEDNENKVNFDNKIQKRIISNELSTCKKQKHDIINLKENSDEKTSKNNKLNYKNYNIDLSFTLLKQQNHKFKKIVAENLDLDYVKLFSKEESDALFRIYESELEYIPDEKAVVKVFGKLHKIPRKQVSSYIY